MEKEEFKRFKTLPSDSPFIFFPFFLQNFSVDFHSQLSLESFDWLFHIVFVIFPFLINEGLFVLGANAFIYPRNLREALDPLLFLLSLIVTPFSLGMDPWISPHFFWFQVFEWSILLLSLFHWSRSQRVLRQSQEKHCDDVRDGLPRRYPSSLASSITNSIEACGIFHLDDLLWVLVFQSLNHPRILWNSHWRLLEVLWRPKHPHGLHWPSTTGIRSFFSLPKHYE